jgi:hypothetical protein
MPEDFRITEEDKMRIKDLRDERVGDLLNGRIDTATFVASMKQDQESFKIHDMDAQAVMDEWIGVLGEQLKQAIEEKNEPQMKVLLEQFISFGERMKGRRSN